MLQAQFVTIVLAAHPTTGVLESALADAAAAQVAYGQVAAKEALATHGYYPFALGRVADPSQAAEPSPCRSLISYFLIFWGGPGGILF